MLSCRIKGESLFSFNGKAYLAKTGEVLYIPTASTYRQETDGETVIAFHLSISENASSEFAVLATAYPEKICALFSKAYTLWKMKPKNYEYLCTAILYEIIGYSNASIPQSSADTSPLLQKAVRILDSTLYDEEFSLQRVCEQAYISRTYFNRLFTEHFHCTPVAYINAKRIARAKQLLKSSLYTNEEIAFLCGFHDVKYFYILFKKTTGHTTKYYKNKP